MLAAQSEFKTLVVSALCCAYIVEPRRHGRRRNSVDRTLQIEHFSGQRCGLNVGGGRNECTEKWGCLLLDGGHNCVGWRNLWNLLIGSKVIATIVNETIIR